MKKIALIFGIIGGLVAGSSFYLKILLDGDGQIDFEGGHLLGYATMVVAFSTIFFAVKQYRDKHLNGSITFGKAFGLGMLITLIASIIYVCCWELFLTTTEIDFAGQYMSYLEDGMKAEGKSAAEIQTALADTKQMMDNYNNNTPMRMGLTFIEIFPVGLLISLISALIFGVFLRKK